MSTDVVSYERSVVASNGTPIVSPANQYAAGRQQVAQTDARTYAMRKELAGIIERQSDRDGYIKDARMLALHNGLLSSGYDLPEVAVHAVEAFHFLSIARAAGIDQGSVTRFMNAMANYRR